LQPTPIDGPLTVRAQVKEIKGRKVVITSVLYAGEVARARGEVVAVQAPNDFVEKLMQSQTDAD